jgi:histidine triad (HIT) family protein
MNERDCVFCNMVDAEKESEVMHNEEGAVAFKDICAKALAHVLVVTNEYVSYLRETENLSGVVTKHIFEATEKMEVAKLGYDFKLDNASGAGQEVFNLHSYVVGSKRLGGMP